jgi:superfamily II DNA or RNA helicase
MRELPWSERFEDAMNIVLLLYPNITLRNQTLDNARRFGMSRYIRDSREWRDSNDVNPCIIISTPGVVYNDIISGLYQDRFKLITAIIADEAHHASCKTWTTIFLGLPNLTRSYGFSALPIRSSSRLAMNFAGMSIEDAMTISVCGPVIYEKLTKELKDFLNIPKLINLHYKWPKDKWVDQKTNDWHKLKALQYKNTERLELIANVITLLVDRKYNTIVHVSEKELGVQLLKLVKNDKVVCWYGGGEVKGQDIDVDTIRRLAGTEILGMICTSHAVEGMDLDTPLNAIVLIDGKDSRQVLQKCGRIMRPDKRLSVIINLMDSGLWILPRHSEQRKQTIQSEFDSDVYDARTLDQLVVTLDMINKGQNRS